jgi:hypothetical protein
MFGVGYQYISNFDTQEFSGIFDKEVHSIASRSYIIRYGYKKTVAMRFLDVPF